MDLPVALFVLFLCGAAIIGLGAGVAIGRWRGARIGRTGGDGAQRQAVLKAELDDAVRTSRREVQGRNRLRAELDDVSAELADNTKSLITTRAELEQVTDRATVATREAGELRARLTDIVGLEAENATLRVIVARVPSLEQRLAECEPTGPEVIDLREGSAHNRR